jgi:hypothetical protein
MLRHTAAVNWLVDLTLENRRRERELRGASVRHYNLPSSGCFEPMHYVRTWLRHVNESTTRLYQTWVRRHDWPPERALGAGARDLIADRDVSS